jgi:hypothetical protein
MAHELVRDITEILIIGVIPYRDHIHLFAHSFSLQRLDYVRDLAVSVTDIHQSFLAHEIDYDDATGAIVPCVDLIRGYE